MKSLKKSLVILLILISNAHFAYAELSVESKENYKTQINNAYTKFMTKTSSLSPEKRLDKLSSIFDKLQKLKQKKYSEKSTFILEYVYILIENSIKLQQNIINTNTEMTRLFGENAKTNTQTKTIEEQVSEAGKTLEKQTSGMAYYGEFDGVKFEYNPNVKIKTSGVKVLYRDDLKTAIDNGKRIQAIIDKQGYIDSSETFGLEKLHPRATGVDVAHIAYHRYYASDNGTASITKFGFGVGDDGKITLREYYSNGNILMLGVSGYSKSIGSTNFQVTDGHIGDYTFGETKIKSIQETLFEKG